MQFDENLPKYYNQNHRFLWEKMDSKLLNESKLFEKIEIDWFSVDEMKRRKKEFRNFYQEIIDLFLKDIKNIQGFLEKKNNKSYESYESCRKTQKIRF
jgi:hypothetical protein